MYIPRGASEADSLLPTPRAPTSWRGQGETSRAGESQHAVAADEAGSLDAALLVQRQFSNDPLQNTNISIGVTVGVVLAVFLAGIFAFLWVYRHRIRCTSRKRRRPSSRKSSKSSKASSHHGSEAEAAPEAAPEAPAEGEAAPA